MLSLVYDLCAQLHPMVILFQGFIIIESSFELLEFLLDEISVTKFTD